MNSGFHSRHQIPQDSLAANPQYLGDGYLEASDSRIPHPTL
ncbi:MAG: hypothetical protein VW236_08310 [Flavobacteriaceae bacterium]